MMASRSMTRSAAMRDASLATWSRAWRTEGAMVRLAGGACAALLLLLPGALAAPAQPRASKANFIILFVDGAPPRGWPWVGWPGAQTLGCC